ncbi:cyclin-A1-like [Synchiropus splendidus]|uniref:cyclin-A1-like n=1 Tax=Synchiropus splendidus TaxID=270530 RepID=UPI00237D62BF|nr:cyclin-A1-like [Synchiropus splendidus]XP_053709530.1 cyclin-A1-like [Synchiropus splendidus]XP_053709605.1 cyclin-A1-like [Synchiropus splendidus]
MTPSGDVLFFSGQQLQVACEVILDMSGEEASPDIVFMETEDSPSVDEDQWSMLEPSPDSSQNSSESDQDEPVSQEDLFSASEYVEDIYWNLRATEERFRPKPGYMDHHPQTLENIRPFTVDWLTRITTDLGLDTETLHLTINYLDRIFSKSRSMKLQDLTLIGTTALFIATKHQSRNPPEAQVFVPRDGSYTKKELLEMEWRLLKTLDFTLSAPTAYTFLHIFMSIYPVCETTQNLAVFLADLSLMDVNLLVRHDSSKVAAAALFMANYRVNRENWPEDLENFSGYSLEDLAECMETMYKLELLHSELPLQAIRSKFTKSMSVVQCCSPSSPVCTASIYNSVF